MSNDSTVLDINESKEGEAWSALVSAVKESLSFVRKNGMPRTHLIEEGPRAYQITEGTEAWEFAAEQGVVPFSRTIYPYLKKPLMNKYNVKIKVNGFTLTTSTSAESEDQALQEVYGLFISTDIELVSCEENAFEKALAGCNESMDHVRKFGLPKTHLIKEAARAYSITEGSEAWDRAAEKNIVPKARACFKPKRK